MSAQPSLRKITREQLVHTLYEAAELEHNLMCTYLYAAFSLKRGVEEGLTAEQAQATERWRRGILDVAIGEMAHLVSVWNITSSLGGAPRFGRGNFPLDPGYLPASVIVKLAPFSAPTLQHFIFLERPEDSQEPDGEGFTMERFQRAIAEPRLTPMAVDYETVGHFYKELGESLQQLVMEVGESAAFCGDPLLQLPSADAGLPGVKPVICAKTALAAFEAIVLQGEGARQDAQGSHFHAFAAIRNELAELQARDPAFVPAHPAATNPVLRRPPRPQGRVWLEDADAVAVVDLANASYQLMLRLLAYSYSLRTGSTEKGAVIDLAIGLMRVLAPLAERAARLPAGPSNPGCNAGVSFTALRDSGMLAPGPAARRFFCERFDELMRSPALASDDARVAMAAKVLAGLAARARRDLDPAAAVVDAIPPPVARAAAPAAPPSTAATSQVVDGLEIVAGRDVTIHYRGKLCIHSRFCVTGAPRVFLANVQGPWIHPDDMDKEELMSVARECPSGAIQYRRSDGGAEESLPPVNLASVRESGPYALRGDLRLRGESIGFRATLCRCGASKNKPYCDGSHHEIDFNATGEPKTTDKTAMLAQRDGVLAIEPQPDGPLLVRGNLEIISGTGRMVNRGTSVRLCRCGGSANKPFCDGTHARNGFKGD